MNRLIASGTVAAMWLSATTPSYAVFGGPFDRGFAHGLSTGTYEAIYQLPNGNGIVRFSESNNGHISQYNISTVFYRGIVYYGNAVGTVNVDSGYATGLSNGQSYGDSQTSANTFFYSGAGGNVGICNATWTADVVENGYNVKFEGEGVAHMFGQQDQSITLNRNTFSDGTTTAETSGSTNTATDGFTNTLTDGFTNTSSNGFNNQNGETVNNVTNVQEATGFNNSTGTVTTPSVSTGGTTTTDTSSVTESLGVTLPQLSNTDVVPSGGNLNEIITFTATYPEGTDVFGRSGVDPVTGVLEFTDPVTLVVTEVFPVTITTTTQVVDGGGNTVGDPITTTSTNGATQPSGDQTLTTTTTTTIPNEPLEPETVTVNNQVTDSETIGTNNASGTTVNNVATNAANNATNNSAANTTNAAATNATNSTSNSTSNDADTTTGGTYSVSLGGEDPVFEDVGHRVPFRVFGSRVAFSTAATAGETYTERPPLVSDADAPFALENLVVDPSTLNGP